MADRDQFEWIGVDELVRRADNAVSTALVYRWAKKGLIPKRQRCKGCKVLVRSDAIDFLQRATETQDS